MERLSSLLFCCLVSLVLANCGSSKHPAVLSQGVPYDLGDGKYDSHFPMRPVEKELEKITEAVKLYTNMSFYEGYDFDLESRITVNDLSEDSYKFKARKKYLFERPSSGTATVIYQDSRKAVLLTCEHITRSPDTLMTYFLDDRNERTSYIQSVAIKTRQSNNVIFLPRVSDVRVLISDRDNDLALLIADFVEKPEIPVAEYSYGLGRASELSWGTFLYVIGYPYGKKMVSTAIVSNPRRDRRNSFIMDATLHRGVSGGLILALRDGPPNFELVGIASALSGEREYVLRPDKRTIDREFEFNRPYEGEIFIDTQLRINYGITFTVSIESIREFIRKNNRLLLEQGISLDRFLK